MAPLIYLNGTYLEGEAAHVSLFDRGYLLGDSVFETLRTYRGMPFRLAQHIERLFHASQVVGIAVPYTRTELADLVYQAVCRSNEEDAYVRITLSRGVGSPGLSPAGCDSPTFSIIIRPLMSYSADAYRQGIESMVVEPRRIPAACLDSTIKCGNYLPGILARRELDARGMIEGVQLGVDGHVVCGTVSNLFLVVVGRLRTPDLASGCLPGITRAAVLELALQAEVDVEETRIEPAELLEADEVFFTNTVMEILPVAEIDGHRFAETPGPVTRTLRAAFAALVQEETASAATLFAERFPDSKPTGAR